MWKQFIHRSLKFSIPSKSWGRSLWDLIVSKLASLILSKFAGLVLPYTFPLTHQKYKEQALSTFTVIVVLVERNSCNSAGSGLGVVGGGVPCRVPTWVERARNNSVLKKIELTSRKFQFWLWIRPSFWDITV